MSVLIKVKVQNIGRFLSKMIMPNISAFIAWGLISGLFFHSGWIPNKDLEKIAGPMVAYLFPILIANKGGQLISGKRGAIVGSIAIIGAAVNTTSPMLLGAMIIGPLGGWIIRWFDKIIKNNIASSFEMLINNFSSGIIGILLSIVSFFVIGPIIEQFSNILEYSVNIIIKNNFLPLISIFIEPAKIFFLNNAINHGIFSSLGMQEVDKFNKSIFFLIESNPGPGIGVLMALFCLKNQSKDIKSSLRNASIIQLLGGIHEVYFPYVLLNPKLIIALILGSMANISVLTIFNGGLVSAASPGSIISIFAMTPKGLYIVNTFSVAISFLVSFIMSFIILKIFSTNYQENDIKILIQREKTTSELNDGSKLIDDNYLDSRKKINKIIVACDAGMGSSAIGAGILKKILNGLNINIVVSNAAIDSISNDTDLVITHKNLTDRARIQHPKLQHLSLNNFLDYNFYKMLGKYLVKNNIDDTKIFHSDKIENKKEDIKINNLFYFTKKNVFLNKKARNKEEAIRFIGEQLVKQGYVKQDYISAMLERENMMSTWLGESIALPHGTIKAKDSILKTGAIFCQFPQGVRFGDDPGDIAFLVIGIAARNNEHVMIVSNITNALDDKLVIKNLSNTRNVNDVLKLFSQNIPR
ncbi:PTS mannitol transporter subunit IICBA [Buchnera aphidicola]|uniref:PTS system mannitol-specific EIICBA component n=1 Tax=Buchnera aphidicola subsp. Melaphis rhois TaxID=118103 RepID=A0A4D6Y201_BUCMH|nr:PTS mannitol transporter subunit IICBA [Buchnera aphidicola]QCI23526.1 PTS mannitol transporter subunit IICBA [Buchnera aphidicola (Melaphis rhois)]